MPFAAAIDLERALLRMDERRVRHLLARSSVRVSS
jgi:hypothetical protein